MIAVIFESEPSEAGKDAYLKIAADLRALLDSVEGFISVERFQSLSEPGKLLSLSFFEDEAAIERWRTQARHRAAQAQGRGGIFANYRLRIAHVVRDYSLTDRAQAPADSRDAHGAAR